MSPLIQNIKWYDSIAFKLFMFVSIILFFAVASISGQNSRLFSDILKRQSEEHLQVATLTVASSFQDSIDYWSSLANVFGHMSSSLDADQIKIAAKGFLDSNEGLAAIQIVSLSENESIEGEIFLFNKIESVDSIGKSIAEVQRSLQQNGKNLIKTRKDNPEQKRIFLKNLENDEKVQVFQIAIRLSKVISGKETIKKLKDTWVIMSVWRSAIAAAFQSSELFSSALLDQSANIVLQANGEKANALRAVVEKSDLDQFTNNQIRSRIWLTNGVAREPVMVSATKLNGFDLYIVAQKPAKMEQEDISRQTRKTLLGSWILFLLALAASYFTAAGLTRRILGLVRSTSEIASGNLSIQLSEVNRDEVGILSRSVNKMAYDLQVLLGVREVAARQNAELKMAENIQKMLIPESYSHHNGILARSYFKPANECAGDWWGRFSFGSGKELIVLADATGHGAHAAIIAALAYSYFATIEKQYADGLFQHVRATNMVNELNTVLYSAGQGQSTMTILLLLFDNVEKKVEAVSAGHCSPFTMTNETSTVISCSGGVLGCEENISVTAKIMEIESGQRFLLYTDGLFECTNNRQQVIKKKRFNDRLASWNVLPFEWISKRIQEIVDDHFKDSSLTDDVTLVLVEYLGEDASAVQALYSDFSPVEKRRGERLNSDDETLKKREASKDETLNPIDSESKTWILS